MPKFADLCELAETKTVVVEGRSLTLRELDSGEVDLIGQIEPAPMAPVGPDPTKGTRATALVPDHTDEKYRRARALWSARAGRLELAASMDWETAKGERYVRGKDPRELRAWAAGVAEEMARIPDRIIDALFVEYRSLGRGKAEEVLGNSSAPAGAPPTPTNSPTATP